MLRSSPLRICFLDLLRMLRSSRFKGLEFAHAMDC
jgi:hypothetical protein